MQDATSQAVAYTYFREDENEARQANVLTHDEALLRNKRHSHHTSVVNERCVAHVSRSGT